MKRFYAWLFGYFWLPCPLCKEYFGGFEMGKGSITLKDGTSRCCCKQCDYQAGLITAHNNDRVWVTPKAAKYLNNRELTNTERKLLAKKVNTSFNEVELRKYLGGIHGLN